MKIVRLSNSVSKKYALFPFFKNERPIESGQKWGMTLKSSGNMRFRWNEENPLRKETLSEIASLERESSSPRAIASVELIHSKDVLVIENATDSWKKCADGIITNNSNLMPVVTVADCVPLYFFDSKNNAFGIVHSGWKGTGIAEKAINLMKEHFSTSTDNLCVAIGAHIHKCCYIVNQERANFFMNAFSANCVSPLKDDKNRASKINWNYGEGAAFRLSLLEANLFLLSKCGVKDENIVILDECTCCNTKFGSNRRQNANGEPSFTVQAAFVFGDRSTNSLHSVHNEP